MLTRIRLPLLFLLFAATCVVAHADATDTDRARDGLNGPVRRVRTETVKVLVKDGKIVELWHNVPTSDILAQINPPAK